MKIEINNFGIIKNANISISPLNIFIGSNLKYVVKKDDQLIIEEPEAHLHPKNQRILVKYLVCAVNKGLKVVLTTHSDYIIEQFNNFVRLNSIGHDCPEEFSYSQEDILNHDDVLIYTFKKDSKKQYIAEKIDINETGFDEETFAPVSEQLVNLNQINGLFKQII